MPEDLVSVAQSLVPDILSNVDRIDEECQLPPELADRMAKHRLFSLYAPAELGGPELDPLTAFRVVETISHADGSAGWCIFNGTAITAAVSRLTPKAAIELFGDPPNLLGSGSARPEGTATIADGGYIINGRWNYLSGIDHSTVLFLNCRLLNPDGNPHLNDEGVQATRIAVVPVAYGTVIDNWTTLGMRGTASNDCEYSNVFVPTRHTYTRADIAHYESPLYHPPQNAILLSWTLAAANALGMARGALDCFHDLATGSGTTNSPALLRDRSYVQITYGECEAMHDAARTFVLDGIGSLWDAQVKQLPDLPDRAIRARLAITHAIRRSVDIVDNLFNVAGTNAIHRSVGLERFFRDLHVSGQHISGLPSNYEYAGQVLMGANVPASLYA
ncbi:MAG: acyl-CoA dehydrogenase family protein [Chloroflexi bacterium]|nr:acyl-CoA dehydrogenase family protein [Chloroflexota bacterium]